MIVTRRLELFLVNDNKEERAKQFASLRLLDRIAFKAANEIIFDQWVLDRIVTRIAEPDQMRIENYAKQIEQLYIDLKALGKEDDYTKEQEKQAKKIKANIDSIKKKRNKIYLEAKMEAQEKIKALVGVGTQQMSWQLIMAKYPELKSSVVDAITQRVTKDFRNDYGAVINGERSNRTYRKGMPVPFRGDTMRFEKTDKGYHVHLFNKMVFGILFGRDRGSRRAEIERIITGEIDKATGERLCDYGDSSIQLKKGKIYLLLALKIPNRPLKGDKDKVLFVEAGFKIPVLCYVNKEDDPVLYGNADKIIRARIQEQERRRKLQIDLKTAAGAHGRQKKLATLEKLGNFEQNWIKTYNHKLSLAVVNYAIRNRCGAIHLIEWKLDPKMNDEEKLKFEGRNWAGHMLKSMVEYKAKMHNIELTVEEKLVKAEYAEHLDKPAAKSAKRLKKKGVL